MILSFFKSNFRQIIQTLLLIVVIVWPLIFDLKSSFSGYLKLDTSSVTDILMHELVSIGDIGIMICLLIFVLFWLQKYNQDYTMNQKNVYHDYNYWWYKYCANILGINQCSLIRVPIYMQIKLVVNAVFKDYPLDEKQFPELENDTTLVTLYNNEEKTNEINLLLEDTYSIARYQIPINKQHLMTIKVQRALGKPNVRYFSPDFIQTIEHEVRKIEGSIILNVFATTNPLATKYVAQNIFAVCNRGNIKHLYVFQQAADEERCFGEKGYKIY